MNAEERRALQEAIDEARRDRIEAEDDRRTAFPTISEITEHAIQRHFPDAKRRAA